MAWREEPLRSPRDLMAATIISAYFGWAGGAADFFWPVVVPLGGIAILDSGSTKDEIAYNQFFLKKITSVNIEYCITLYTDSADSVVMHHVSRGYHF